MSFKLREKIVFVRQQRHWRIYKIILLLIKSTVNVFMYVKILFNYFNFLKILVELFRQQI